MICPKELQARKRECLALGVKRILFEKDRLLSKIERLFVKEEKIVDNSYYASIPKRNPSRKNLSVRFDNFATVYIYDPETEVAVQNYQTPSSAHTSEPSSESPQFTMDPLAVVRQENANLAISRSRSNAESESKPRDAPSTHTDRKRKKRSRAQIPNYIETILHGQNSDLWASNYGHDVFEHYNVFDRARAAYARTNLAVRNLNDPRIYGPLQPSNKERFTQKTLAQKLFKSLPAAPKPTKPRAFSLASPTPTVFSSSSASPTPTSFPLSPPTLASSSSASSSASSSSSSSSAPVMHHNPNTTYEGYYYVHNKYLFRRTLRAHRKKREREAKYEEHMQTTMGPRHSLKKNAALAPKLDIVYEVEEPEDLPEDLLPGPYVPHFYTSLDNVVDAEEVSAVSSDDSLLASSLDSFQGDSIRFYGAVKSPFSLLRSCFVALFGLRQN